MDRRPVVLLPGLTPHCMYWSVVILVLGAVTLLVLPGGWRAVQRSYEGANLDSDSTASRTDTGAVDRPGDVWVVPSKEMLKQTYVGYTVWDVAAADLPGWKVKYSNPAAAGLSAHGPEECLEASVPDCFPAMSGEGGQRFAELVKFARDSGDIVNVGVLSLRTGDQEGRYYFSVIAPINQRYVALIYYNLFDGDTSSTPLPYTVSLEISDAQVLQAQLEALQRSVTRVRAAIERDP